MGGNTDMEVRVVDKRSVVGVLLALTFGFTITGYAQEVDRSISLEHYQALQSPLFLQLLDRTYPLGVTDVENKGRGGSAKRAAAIVGQFGASGALAVGASIAFVPFFVDGGLPDFWVIASYTTGIGVGYIFSSTGAVYAIGRLAGYDGSFWKSFFYGGVLPVGLGIGSVGIIGSLSHWFEGNEVVNLPFGAIFGMWVSPVFQTLAYHLTARKSSTESRTALINFSHGQMSLAVPSVYFRPHPFDAGSLSQSVDLVRVRF